jgi:predicted metal-dependent peptidase
VTPNIQLAVVVDTSGSMSDRCLGEAVGELSGILKALPRQDGVKVYACDAAVHTAQKCFRAEQVQLAGGGGTDMTLAIKHASDVKPRPQLVICLTDGYTDWPKEPTNGVPCLAVIVSNGDDTSPDWIRSIKLPKHAFGNDES